ncbi:MAG: outer membrane protein transport protein [Acidobacteriota bacterium]|nr:outer membrane protein transport protein [Acidobacteriota bacterium]
MRFSRRLFPTTAATAALALLATAPLAAGGFSVFEQGSKAMGMAGAFTAQADDPSALFHNVGGLGFFEERDIALGVTLVTSTDESFVGAPPGFATGSTASISSLAEPVPHFYWVQPTGRSWNFGLAVNAPFGLKTEWENPDAFAGRFINTEASMLVLDVNPNFGVKLTDNFGIGFGLIARFSKIELNRRQATTNPFTGGLAEFAAVRLESDMDQGLGWQLGLLHRYNPSFSWGFSYRSNLTVDYGGNAVFTQIPTGTPQLDAILAATIPFGQNLPVTTAIEFPDTASLGVAMALGPESLLEIDVNWAGWSSFDALRVDFTGNPAFDFERRENWKDVYNYRLGLRFGRGSGSEWLLGFVMDESPQPTASVSPLLPDADRNGYTAGWSREGGGVDLDLAVMYLDFAARTVDNSIDMFNGTYSQTGWLFAATLGF